MNKQPIAKYRPVLTESQILHILHLCRKDSSTESMGIVGVLAQMEYKIRNGAMSPAHLTIPKTELIEALGFTSAAELSSNESVRNIENATAESLYTIWMTGATNLLSKDDIARVREYRYMNNKMTMDEEKLYEKEILGASEGWLPS